MMTAAVKIDTARGRFLIVTWDAGGNVPPALELGRRLVARGHSVRLMGQRQLQERVEATGCTFRALPSLLEWDASKGRALEDQSEFFFGTVLAGMPMAEAVITEVGREPVDVLLVDCLLRSALCAAETTRQPTAVLLHLRYRFGAQVDDPTRWGWDFDPVNAIRQRLGLQPIVREAERLIIRLWRQCDRVLALMPREFEDYVGPLPANVRYVGPIIRPNDDQAAWDLPWPPDHPAPLIVVSFSTTYMHHEALVHRLLTALGALPVHVLVTLGGGLEPSELAALPGVVVRRYVPHAMVLPHASLVVTHGGTGTIMAAFANGVPLLCMPLGRDQPGNARRAEALGAGRTLSPDASVVEVRDAVVDMLTSEALRAGARRLAEVVAGYERRDQAITELESLLGSPGRAR